MHATPHRNLVFLLGLTLPLLLAPSARGASEATQARFAETFGPIVKTAKRNDRNPRAQAQAIHQLLRSLYLELDVLQGPAPYTLHPTMRILRPTSYKCTCTDLSTSS